MDDLWIDFDWEETVGWYSVKNKATRLKQQVGMGSPVKSCLYDARELAKVLGCKLMINGLEDDGSKISLYIKHVGKTAELFST